MSDYDVPDFDDDQPSCPDCGKRCVRDWEGDPSVINGTRDFFTCPDCGGQVIDEGSPMAVTEMIIARLRAEEAAKPNPTEGGRNP